MTLLLIGIGIGGSLGMALGAILAGGRAFDDGYRCGMQVGESIGGHRWHVKPPDGDWLPTTEAVARSIECDGWRVAEIEEAK